MAEKPDPFDVEALGSAVNDSAGRVSTIWISFLIFALYLLTAAATVTQRQLFFAEPVKLPVLNIDLPLWGFFFLAPILFVIFHIYVLLQVMLLARTAAAYNEAVRRLSLTAEENVSLRQRLANTLFAQIFAGSPREREGWLGWLLKAMAWITLAVAPILILVFFQFAFLPYHSHIATWTHRFLILAELVVAFVLWPLVLDAERDFEWSGISSRLKDAITLPSRLFGPKGSRQDAWSWVWQRRLAIASSILYVFVCWSLATFPGEWHVNLLTGHLPSSIECKRWLQQDFGLLDLRFDRLDLRHVDAIDHEKLAKIEKATNDAGKRPYQGERTRDLRARNLNCADLSNFADLERVDFTDSTLQGAFLDDAQLQGASLDGVELQSASLFNAQLQDASLGYAELQGASLSYAGLQATNLAFAQLQGASLFNAELQGAFLYQAKLQGADLEEAKLQAASLDYAQLQGASLDGAQLQGASLNGSKLQGASLNHAYLQGASAKGAWLQGANFGESSMALASLSNAYVWRAQGDCQKSRVINHKPDAIVVILVRVDGPDITVKAVPDQISNFIEQVVGGISDGQLKDAARKRMRAGLGVDPVRDDTVAIEKVWAMCEETSAQPSRAVFDQIFEQNHAAFLRKLVCDDTNNGRAIARGISRNWISDSDDRRAFSAQLARGLLGEDGKPCATTKDFDQVTIDKLHEAAAYTVSAPAPAASAPTPAVSVPVFAVPAAVPTK